MKARGGLQTSTIERVSTVVNSQPIRNVLQSLIYMGLLFATVIFVQGVIKEYQEGATYFSVSEQPITNADLPTATVCFLAHNKVLQQGRDYKIQTGVTWAATPKLITLKKGKNEYSSDFGSRLVFIKELIVWQYTKPMNRSCFSLSFGMQEPFYMNMWSNTSHSLGLFLINFELSLKELEIEETTLYVTSEINSYGAVTLRWFDGEAKPLYLQKGKYHNIQIYKIKRYEYLKDKCRDTSFYHCMGSNLEKSKKCKKGDNPCGPYSLPSTTKFEEYPICENTTKCKEHVDDIWLGKVGKCKSLTPCLVQVYGIQESKVGPGMEKQPQVPSDSFSFYLDMDSPDGTHGGYSDELKVEAHTEHLAWTFKCLIGNIGGYLGLCVGFSFTGLISWMFNMLPRVRQALIRFWQ